MAKIIDNYILLEHICQGTFGEIHKGRNLISKEAVAVKTIQLEQFLNDSVLRDMIINEIQALKKLEDPNIIRMIKMLKSSNNIYLIYEFLQGRNLKKLLNERHHLSEMEAVQIFQQICKGFQRLQSEKIIKKNLNSHNVHIIEHQSDNQQINYEVKLKHFFICKSSSSNSSSSRKFEQFLNEKFHYVAPELLVNSQADSTVCDIFSAGVVLYEMLLGSLPFEKYANNKEDLTEFYSNNDIQDVIAQDISHLSERIQSLLNRMLVVEQDERITWEEIFEIVAQLSDQKASNNNKNTLSNSSKVGEQSPHQFGTSPRKHVSMNNAQLSSLNNQNINQFKSDIEEGDQKKYSQGKLSAQKQISQKNNPQNSSSNANNNDSDQEETTEDEIRASQNGQGNQKSNKKSKSNVAVNNNALNQIVTGTINLSNNQNQQKAKFRNNSEATQQLQEAPSSPPIATVNLNYNKSQQNINLQSNNQKEIAQPVNPFYASANSKINKENSLYKMNEFSSSMMQNNKRENSIDPQINQRQSQQSLTTQNGNLINNANSSGSKINKEAINLILEEIMDKRSKIQVILGALDNCMEQDEWNVNTLNAYSCGFILLKKACGLSEYLMQIFENPQQVLGHLNLSESQFQAWNLSQKKQQIKLNIMRENLELKNNLMKFQDDFSENIQIYVNNSNIYNSKRGGDEIDNDEVLNTILFETSKEMSAISAQTKNRKSLVLAHYLADIACIDIMYNKFLGKKRLDVLNHPYFKKLSEISREKLQENLDNKFKLYEYHRACSDI
ncbi:hypothetical protein ABPG74_000940 [Tetrahymena malaccensis]